MTDWVRLPHGSAFLRLTPAEFATVMARGLDPGPSAAPAAPGVVAGALLDSRAMGERLSVSAEQVEAMAKRGEIASIRVGRYLRFDPAEVLASLKTNGHAD